ncbi:hypothetical protein ColTof4_08141 [Colletotrichum tofieldiae]|nr:hypothetical protein ColTof3_02337 [Colletotrichum tofieldiae]GKT75718.1 hypothetical protein ColTof4_08141 [Colletotrichum tofieldiae]GKT83411.1 hypothetical protein Ct61P_01261 [Colletotrichum tofieldiae]
MRKKLMKGTKQRRRAEKKEYSKTQKKLLKVKDCEVVAAVRRIRDESSVAGGERPLGISRLHTTAMLL